MYVNPNFKTKKALKEAVKAWVEYQAQQQTRSQLQLAGPFTLGAVLASKTPVTPAQPVTVYSPGPFPCPSEGTVSVEGPHYPQPHTWYATVLVNEGRVVKVVS